MTVNLTDWFGTHLMVLWVLIGIMLLALELLRRDWSLATASLGATAAALVAVVFPQAWYAQLVVGVVVAVAGVLVVRPAIRRHVGLETASSETAPSA